MTIQAVQIITIGTAKFIIDDIRDGHRVGDVVLRYTLRDGFIKLNGATVLREDYPRLVQWIEDNNLWTDDETALGLFGVGDGLTTMRLPDFRNRFLEGVDSNGGVVVGAGLPNITGKLAVGNKSNYLNISMAIGAFKVNTQLNTSEANQDGSGKSTNIVAEFYASNCSSIYGNSETVQPAAVRLISQIKY